MRIEVDGEVFEVRGKRKQFHYDWISGPNQGYGFGQAVSGGGTLTRDDHVEAIREFLAGIDPETGYLSDD